ncbi:acyl-CoA thioesterase [Sulfurospirillum deleyianum]|uniref:Thioesterase superfamily protein n=1 Tax=Sulfurospirillum deleyianum (strain ATCC 51133 / DSM 6946 / 5175) TaxID=525898 RepID=D1B470_SULD5|nr:acyl-CoA thioesterase [Sulfurospirillum deleyianum]ACZ12890.1 thioesterase superfamily protein [Sulfurospirillum deleyianum DSM 6946]
MNTMGEPRIKMVAMPKDTNPAGNIFGGWIMSQIDIAGALATRDLNVGRVVTVAVHSMEFKEPLHVGDVISCYGKIMRVGTTSLTVQVEVNAERSYFGERRCLHVTSAVLTYVHVDKEGTKIPIPYTHQELLALGIESKK